MRFFGRPASHDDRGRRARAQDGLRRSCRCAACCEPTAATAWSTARRSSGRASGRRDEDIAALTQHLTTVIEGWVRETPRAVAVAAPALEDAAPPAEPPSAVRGRSAAGPARSARDRPRAPPRPRAELDRRRRALAARAARPAPALPGRAPRGPRAALGGRALPGGARGGRDRGEPRARAPTSRSLRGPLRPRPCSSRTPSARRSCRGAPASPSAGATRPTAAGRCSRGAAACPRASGAAARCTTIGRCSKASGSRSRARPTPRSRAPRSGPRGAARSSATTGPGSASTPAPSTAPPSAGCPSASRPRPTSWPGGAGRRSRSWAAPRSGRSARRSRRAAGARRACSAARRRSPSSSGVLSRLRLLLTNDSGPMHLAAALGTPLVAVFGSTDWTETAPVAARAARRAREPVTARPACCASARSTTAA